MVKKWWKDTEAGILMGIQSIGIRHNPPAKRVKLDEHEAFLTSLPNLLKPMYHQKKLAVKSELYKVPFKYECII